MGKEVCIQQLELRASKLQNRVNCQPSCYADCFVAGHCQPKSDP